MYPVKYPTVKTLPFRGVNQSYSYAFKGYQSSRIPFEDHDKIEKNYSFEISFKIFISYNI